MLLSLLAGSLTWSLAHYVGHRVWHHFMEQGKSGGPLEKEVLHHIHYDPPAHPHKDHIGFPWEMWAMASALAGAGFFLSSNPLWFAVGIFGSTLLDDQFHRLHHRGQLNVKWFDDAHKRHHVSHSSNYAMVTGAVWDKLFGTF